tara:strand:+ start:1949 stop:2233 length:285 start_codon:yes stop_codon:yes gene_type:complete
LSKKELIKQLKRKNPQLKKFELENVINIFYECIITSLKNRNNAEIRGFGRWYCKILKENFNARNPATNELIYKPERVKVRFKPSKKLKKIINDE